jgi:hypothetical protein
MPFQRSGHRVYHWVYNAENRLFPSLFNPLILGGLSKRHPTDAGRRKLIPAQLLRYNERAAFPFCSSTVTVDVILNS